MYCNGCKLRQCILSMFLFFNLYGVFHNALSKKRAFSGIAITFKKHYVSSLNNKRLLGMWQLNSDLRFPSVKEHPV